MMKVRRLGVSDGFECVVPSQSSGVVASALCYKDVYVASRLRKNRAIAEWWVGLGAVERWMRVRITHPAGARFGYLKTEWGSTISPSAKSPTGGVVKKALVFGLREAGMGSRVGRHRGKWVLGLY